MPTCSLPCPSDSIGAAQECPSEIGPRITRQHFWLLGHFVTLRTTTRRIPLTLSIFLLLVAGSQAQSTVSAIDAKTILSANNASVLPDAPSASIKNPTAIFESADNQAAGKSESLSVAWSPVTGEQDHIYKPLSIGQKFQMFLENSYSSSTITVTALSAQAPSLLHVADEEQHWNLGRRYAAAYVDTQSSAFFENFLIPALTHQDPLYHREALGTVRSRVSYAMTRVFVARSDKGGSSFNTSSVAGAFVSSAIHNAYHPYNNSSADGTVNRALGHLATRAGMNIVREFWPDVRRRFHGRVGAMMEAYKP